MRSESKARWPPMWTRIAAFGFVRSALASKSSKDMQRSVAVAVDELDLGRRP